MCRRLIQALAILFLVGIAMISTGKDAYAAADHRPVTYATERTVIDVRAAPALANHQHMDHDEHGGVPCQHGGCSVCCAACLSAAMAVNCHATPVLIEAQKDGPHLASVEVLPDIRLSVLPFRPPCAIA